MPDHHSRREASSSSSSSSDSESEKESKKKRRSSSSESDKKKHSKRTYSSSEEDRRSRKRKELTVLSRNAKYGHRGFVGDSFSRYNRSRSRSNSRGKYRARDHWHKDRYSQRDRDKHSRSDRYHSSSSSRRYRERGRHERHHSDERRSKDRSRDSKRSRRDRDRSRDKKEKSRERSRDKKERSRESSREKDRSGESSREKDRSRDKKERSREHSQEKDRSRDKKERNREHSREKDRRSKDMKNPSEGHRREKRARDRSHSGDEDSKKKNVLDEDHSLSKDKRLKKRKDSTETEEDSKKGKKIDDQEREQSIEMEKTHHFKRDQEKRESHKTLKEKEDQEKRESHKTLKEKEDLDKSDEKQARNRNKNNQEGEKNKKGNIQYEAVGDVQKEDCKEHDNEYKKDRYSKKGENNPEKQNEDKKREYSKKDVAESFQDENEIKHKDSRNRDDTSHSQHTNKDSESTRRKTDSLSRTEEKKKSSDQLKKMEQVKTNLKDADSKCDEKNASMVDNCQKLDSSSTLNTRSSDKLIKKRDEELIRKSQSPNYSSKHHSKESREASPNQSSHPTEECEVHNDHHQIECESADLDELQRMKDQITQELMQNDHSKKHKSKKKKKDKNKDHADKEEFDTKSVSEDSSKRKRSTSVSYKDNSGDDDKKVKSKTSSRRHKRKHSKSDSIPSISPEINKDIKIKEKPRKMEKLHEKPKEGRDLIVYDTIENDNLEESNKETSKNKKNLLVEEKNNKEIKLEIKKPVVDPLSKKTGGAYIPPGRLKLMQDQIKDKSSETFQRLSWEALKKSINGIVNKVNVSNIGIIIRELFEENIVRGRGLLCRSLMQAQSFSQTFTHVYAALVCAINTKFPQIGELLLNRLIIQLRRGIKRNDKNICMASCRFLAHLINQQVAHEVIALELLTLLLEKAKDLMDESENGVKSREASIELAIVFLKECGMKLGELAPKGLTIISESLRNILHEGKLDSRYRYMVESLFAIQKDNFKEFQSVIEELDLVDETDKITHIVELDGKLDGQEILNIFKVESDYLENETKYKELKAGILGASDDEGSDAGSGSNDSDSDGDSGSSSEDEEKEKADGELIVDRTETNMISFRRTVYLTIQSSLDVDECAHKLLKGEVKPGWEEELCNMIIDCCAQQRTYIKFYGLLAARFCLLNKIYREHFESLFNSAYGTCHRLEIEKLRNVSKLFSHLLHTDAISWEVMENVHLNEDQTTSSSRVFLKILFEELANFMGLNKLNERLREPTLAHAFEGLFPRDNPNKTRFAINFFTSIGLGGLTDDLREFLRTQPKPTAVVAPVQKGIKMDDSSSDSSEDSSSGSDSESSDSSSDSSSSSSDSSSSDSSSSDSSDSSSDSEKESKKKLKKKKTTMKDHNMKEKSKLTSSKSKKKHTEEPQPTLRSRIVAIPPEKRTSSSSKRSSSSRKGSSHIV